MVKMALSQNDPLNRDAIAPREMPNKAAIVIESKASTMVFGKAANKEVLTLLPV